jgi:hypothetical protein
VTPHKRVSALHHSDITCPGNKCGDVYLERPCCSVTVTIVCWQSVVFPVLLFAHKNVELCVCIQWLSHDVCMWVKTLLHLNLIKFTQVMRLHVNWGCSL